ncbi:MAG TPA: cupin domain-containing protein [Thermoanaerobaculia bacterium]
MSSLAPEELALLDQIAAASVEPVPPPDHLRAAVLEQVRATPQMRLDESIPRAEESATVRVDDGRWLDAAPGVRVKKLSVDRNRGTITVLMELAPHAVLPAHDHHGSEDSFVVAGSCRIGAVALAQGDFHHVESTAHHGNVVATGEGCTLLVTMDRADFEAA